MTLSSLMRVNSHILEYKREDRRQYRVKYRPEQKVLSRIGELRYHEHQTIEGIARELRQGGMSISIKETQSLSEIFLALVKTCLKTDWEIGDARGICALCGAKFIRRKFRND